MDAIDAFLSKLQHIPEREMRIALVREFLLEADAELVVELVGAMVERCLVGQPPGEDGVLALVPCLLDLESDSALYERLGDVYRAAVGLRDAKREPDETSGSAARPEGQRYEVVGKLLLNPPPLRRPPKRAIRFGPKWDKQVTLGERKAFALGGNRVYLERLLYDADASVIARLCRNPRITEQDVLLVATRRPNHREVLAEVARSPWLTRYAVRRALVSNPYAGTGLVLRLLPLLHAPHLAALRFVGDLHPSVVETARLLVDWRDQLSAGGETAPGQAPEHGDAKGREHEAEEAGEAEEAVDRTEDLSE